jgi:sugar/nucleoside kinase (ribokinase family)
MIYTVTLNPTIDRTMVFPRLDVGELNRATQSRTDLSGKGVNVSVALRQLGLESTMIGIAAGVYGRLLLNGLRDMGYDCDFIEVAGETRSNVTVIDEARNETTKLNEPGPTVSAADLDALAGGPARIAPATCASFPAACPPAPRPIPTPPGGHRSAERRPRRAGYQRPRAGRGLRRPAGPAQAQPGGGAGAGVALAR